MEVNREYPIDAKVDLVHPVIVIMLMCIFQVQRLSISLHWVSGGSDVSYSLYEFDDAVSSLFLSVFIQWYIFYYRNYIYITRPRFCAFFDRTSLPSTAPLSK